jgi:hypothetical protein
VSDYLQPADVAAILAVSPKKVRLWIRTGALKASNLNDNRRPRWIIRRDDLDEFVQARQVEPQQRPTTRRRVAVQRLPTDRY